MKKLLIRAEDKNRWERRAPIVPTDLGEVVNATGAKALVEKSDKRVFDQSRYEAAGAAACDDMADGEVIFGVKEIPVEKILDNKTYLFSPTPSRAEGQHAAFAEDHRLAAPP